MEAHANGFGGSLEDYCLELKAAKAGKFAVKAGETPLAYAFHLDATAPTLDFCGKKANHSVSGESKARSAKLPLIR